MKNKGTKKETVYDDVYGNTFSLYKRQDLEDFILPLKQRWELNNLNAPETFKGLKCLDAGCGNGRGTIFMFRNGAHSVTSLDVSPVNVKSTTAFVKENGFKNHTSELSTLEAIPYPDETFDFVWCNGVIMHTSHPNKCLSELARVLKVGGKAWIYVYGSGGIYWRIIHAIRDSMKSSDINATISLLRLMRYEPRYVAEFIDDWFASHLRAYTNKDFTAKLEALGFDHVVTLNRGMPYDTSERRHLFNSANQLDYMGEGDLRYLVTKVATPNYHKNLIDEGEYGSEYQWPEITKQVVDQAMSQIALVVTESPSLKVAAYAYLQRELRLLLNDTSEISEARVADLFNTVLDLSSTFKTRTT